jgi:hypothetical protein
MGRKIGAILIVISGLLVLLNTGITLAQQEKSPAQSEVSVPSEIQWLWGEVASVDPANKAFVVKYLDYDTDMEKQVTMYVDDKTGFENIKSLADIKAQDTVSIDYTVGSDGKDLAINISVEKIEDIEDPASLDGTMPIPEKVGTGPIMENTAAAVSEPAVNIPQASLGQDVPETDAIKDSD